MTWILPNSLISRFALDTAALTWGSDESCQACGRLLVRRSKNTPAASWRRAWKAGTLILPRSGQMLRPSHSETFTAAWISSLGVTPANLSAQQESGSARTTPDTSGLGSQTAFDFASPPCASSRTSRDTSPSASAMSSENWQALVTEQRGEYSRRLKSARLTSASGSSSWPTASARDWKDTPGMSTEREGNPMGRVDQLPRAVYHAGRPAPASPSTDGSRLGLLNPDWVEALMGLPAGWTDCASSVTESSQPPQSSHSAPSSTV